MPGQCVVAVGAEDDWRVRASGRDDGMDAFPQGGTWTAGENWRLGGNAGAGTFLLREERKMAGKMRIGTEVNIEIWKIGSSRRLDVVTM